MRSIQVEKVRDAVRDMCIEANYSLSPDMRCVFEKACQEEKSPLGRQILNQLSENLKKVIKSSCIYNTCFYQIKIFIPVFRCL